MHNHVTIDHRSQYRSVKCPWYSKTFKGKVIVYRSYYSTVTAVEISAKRLPYHWPTLFQSSVPSPWHLRRWKNHLATEHIVSTYLCPRLQNSAAFSHHQWPKKEILVLYHIKYYISYIYHILLHKFYKHKFWNESIVW